MPNCIFCDILAGIAPAYFIHRDDLCAAFMDIRPVNPGHVLVVPRTHAALLPELDEGSVGQMLKVAQRVDVAIRTSGIKCEAVNLIISDGAAAGQEVPHIHLHVIPRFRGDGHHFRFNADYFTRISASELGKNAELIRTQMGGQP
jgi:histidine triad (HIT) family protein